MSNACAVKQESTAFQPFNCYGASNSDTGQRGMSALCVPCADELREEFQ